MGIAVPEAEEVMLWAKKEGAAGANAAEVLAGADGPKLKTAVMAQLTRAASKGANLVGFEMVRSCTSTRRCGRSTTACSHRPSSRSATT